MAVMPVRTQDPVNIGSSENIIVCKRKHQFYNWLISLNKFVYFGIPTNSLLLKTVMSVRTQDPVIMGSTKNEIVCTVEAA
jgi:hypothetical protein